MGQDRGAVHDHGQRHTEGAGRAEVSDLGHNGLVAPVAAVEFAEEPFDRHVVDGIGDEVEFVVRRDVEVGGGIGRGALHEVHHVVNHERRGAQRDHPGWAGHSDQTSVS